MDDTVCRIAGVLGWPVLGVEWPPNLSGPALIHRLAKMRPRQIQLTSSRCCCAAIPPLLLHSKANNMARTPKSFVVEVKRAPGRSRKNSIELTASPAKSKSNGRNETGRARPVAPAVSIQDPVRPPWAQARILPDLLSRPVPQPEPSQPRRRGRPKAVEAPLPRTKRPASGHRRAANRKTPPQPAQELSVELPPFKAPQVDFARRHRDRDDVSALPRSQRWKRRLPKVCW